MHCPKKCMFRTLTSCKPNRADEHLMRQRQAIQAHIRLLPKDMEVATEVMEVDTCSNPAWQQNFRPTALVR